MSGYLIGRSRYLFIEVTRADMRRSPTISRINVANARPVDVYVSPVNLTANGRAHLGHAAGPYLRMDIVQKHLKRAGHHVRSGLTTDGFENHVLVRAARENVDPSDLAHAFHTKIVEDLASVGIVFDQFDDPAYGRNLRRFSKVGNALMGALSAAGSLHFSAVHLPMDDTGSAATPREERFCIGGWFGATCPVCLAAAGSFFCERCGHHFEPEEALNPLSRRGRIVEWPENISAFLSIPEKDLLLRAWDDTAIEAGFLEIGHRYVARKGQQMRLTVPGLHGLAWKSRHFDTQQILFSYSSLLYAHSLYCGQKDTEDAGKPSPFARESDAFLIGGTGIDNTIPMLVGVTGCALGQNSFRSFDRIFFNHFLRLNGSKFSTSRGHVIWAGDIATIPDISVDVLRVYLSEICPEEAETDLVPEQLVHRYNAVLDRISAAIDRCTESINAMPALAGCHVDGAMMATLDGLYEKQCAALSLDHLRVSQASRPVIDWVDHLDGAPDHHCAYTWLMGFSILAWPLMPKIAGALWHWFGHGAHPVAARASTPSFQRCGTAPQIGGRRLAVADIERCLPGAA
ncbi:class I tRNA ligase family protein [Bradyrhizobium australafricanum]|uniref:class I tRNA ligase family protein n=1 Tax=Bradyrhizobium australafricanum TaxID=2821406 RepID=UPI0028A0D519|nr:class I tRNA ligase family protein [Bradyrhizobium australafricanum]MCA6101015.1 class I tRNA ligase family protein [Bradyrhizobium australafricanum]